MTFESTMEHTVRVFEAVGVVILGLGLVWAAVVALLVLRRGKPGRTAYKTFREVFGGAILMSLEVLVAADLIRTVTIDTTLESVTVLGLIVLIRTVLSFSLEIEIDGIPPWRRALVSGGSVAADATRRGLT
ncbi:MAG TPA: DUF1622 domain-containing protein [Actinomycetes bacterium]|nr:DUF1622 domain-containing protein [Actinomycetes bacterium]